MSLMSKFKEWWYAPVLKRLDDDDGPADAYQQWQAHVKEAIDTIIEEDSPEDAVNDPEYLFLTTGEEDDARGLATARLKEVPDQIHVKSVYPNIWLELKPHDDLPIALWGLTYGNEGRVYLSRKAFRSALTQLGNPEDARFWRAGVIWEETVLL